MLKGCRKNCTTQIEPCQVTSRIWNYFIEACLSGWIHDAAAACQAIALWAKEVNFFKKNGRISTDWSSILIVNQRDIQKVWTFKFDFWKKVFCLNTPHLDPNHLSTLVKEDIL